MKESETWDISAIAKILEAKPRPCQDILLGPGHELSLKGAAVHLDLYPERLIARLRHPNFQLYLANVSLLEATSTHVHIESGDEDGRAAFFLRPNGTVALSASSPAKSCAEPAPPATATPPADEVAETKREELKGERVVLTGRVGRDPELRKTSKGRQVVKVSLAVHQGEKTTWRNVYFFDEKAEQAAETLHKGDLATVVGYKHQREITTKTGIKKQVEEIYGVATQPGKGQKKS